MYSGAVLELCVFFLQAEDGIRDYKVTGVQTCALPIYVDTVERNPYWLEAHRKGAEHLAVARPQLAYRPISVVRDPNAAAVEGRRHRRTPHGESTQIFAIASPQLRNRSIARGRRSRHPDVRPVKGHPERSTRIAAANTERAQDSAVTGAQLENIVRCIVGNPNICPIESYADRRKANLEGPQDGSIIGANLAYGSIAKICRPNVCSIESNAVRLASHSKACSLVCVVPAEQGYPKWVLRRRRGVRGRRQPVSGCLCRYRHGITE